MYHRDYKVYADSGVDLMTVLTSLAILDTGAGPCFARWDVDAQTINALVNTGPLPDICDRINNALRMKDTDKLPIGFLELLVNIDIIFCKRTCSPIHASGALFCMLLGSHSSQKDAGGAGQRIHSPDYPPSLDNRAMGCRGGGPPRNNREWPATTYKEVCGEQDNTSSLSTFA